MADKATRMNEIAALVKASGFSLNRQTGQFETVMGQAQDFRTVQAALPEVSEEELREFVKWMHARKDEKHNLREEEEIMYRVEAQQDEQE
jgi:hypothetical protein